LDIALLPPTFPAALADRVWRCMSRDPANRPTLAEVRGQISPTPDAPVIPMAPAAVPSTATAPVPATAAAPAPIPKSPSVAPPSVKAEPARAVRRWSAAIPILPPRVIARTAAAGVAVLILLWIGIRAFRSHPPSAPPVAVQPAQQNSALAAPSPTSQPPTSSTVVHEEMPAVSRGARASIRGQIKVVVRVSVDRAGSVIAENLEVHGSSRYFARVATEAAKQWKFAPADSQSPREWLVRFEFSRDGTTAHAVPRGKP
jgi:hypothetical protein